MTLNNALLGLLALTMFAAAAVVSLGPIKANHTDPYSHSQTRSTGS